MFNITTSLYLHLCMFHSGYGENKTCLRSFRAQFLALIAIGSDLPRTTTLCRRYELFIFVHGKENALQFSSNRVNITHRDYLRRVNSNERSLYPSEGRRTIITGNDSVQNFL